MSMRYPGAIISATPPTTTGGETGTASGAWTLEQQMQAQAAGNWPSQPPVPYIENVFQTWLYTGNGSSQTITNGINLSGRGGMVWIKQRSAARDNLLFDTTRGATQRLFSNLTLAQSQDTQSLTAFTSSGFSVGSDSGCNINAGTYASWTFRKQPKFFDVVTYTGNGVLGRTISHNLGSAPGFMIVKCTSSAADWACYHQALGPSYSVLLNSTSAAVNTRDDWVNGSLVPTAPTSTQFTVSDGFGVNGNGQTYVAYLFAHNAGGFGLTETENVISCGSYTGNGSTTGPVVTLGYEPQWVMVKRTDLATNWIIFDTMRGMSQTDAMLLYPNLSDDEGIGTQGWLVPTATGFQPAITNGAVNANGGNYIYVAIRRGPMQTPTSGTSVFAPIAATNTTGTTNTTNFPIDLQLYRVKDSAFDTNAIDRLRGISSNTTESGVYFQTNDTDLEFGAPVSLGWDNVSFKTIANLSSSASVWWNFRRAPGFFDEVCYTGTGSATTFSHNLGVVPELMIVKRRDAVGGWLVYSSTLGATKYLVLQGTNAEATASTIWNNTTPTSSVFTVATASAVNASGGTYANYLFASCPGVSRVGSYTGNGSSQTINCGFTGGARFILIKRTDSTGDWYVWDSARGIVAGNDPYLLLNSTAAEVTNTDYVDTYSAGFEISSTAPAAINANGGTFIFLAIA